MVLFQVRCWEVTHQGQTIPKAQQTHTGPVLDCDWSDVSLYLVDKCNSILIHSSFGFSIFDFFTSSSLRIFFIFPVIYKIGKLISKTKTNLYTIG